MTDNVTSLRGGEIISDRKRSFLDGVAQAFDDYVASEGREPDALVHILCGVKQTSVVGWNIHGESDQGATSLLCLAAVHLQAEASSRMRTVD